MGDAAIIIEVTGHRSANGPNPLDFTAYDVDVEDLRSGHRSISRKRGMKRHELDAFLDECFCGDRKLRHNLWIPDDVIKVIIVREFKLRRAQRSPSPLPVLVTTSTSCDELFRVIERKAVWR